jgi:hypothetical protein
MAPASDAMVRVAKVGPALGPGQLAGGEVPRETQKERHPEDVPGLPCSGLAIPPAVASQSLGVALLIISTKQGEKDALIRDR